MIDNVKMFNQYYLVKPYEQQDSLFINPLAKNKGIVVKSYVGSILAENTVIYFSDDIKSVNYNGFEYMVMKEDNILMYE